MAITYEPIATTTVPSDTTSGVTFSSIPQTYTDLVLVISAAASGSLRYRINGSTSNYWNRYLEGSITSTVSTFADSTTANKGWITESARPSSTLGSGISVTNFMNYTNTVKSKMAISKSAANNGVDFVTSWWNDTTAVSSIVVAVNDAFTGTLYAGSILTLYGILKAA